MLMPTAELTRICWLAFVFVVLGYALALRAKDAIRVQLGNQEIKAGRIVGELLKELEQC
jgi:hypothetical protein